MDTRPQISAIICTFNRAKYLEKSIQSLATQTLNKNSYEILIVDNNSTDETKLVVNTFLHLKNVKYFFEPIQGLSQARNTGWRSAKGQFVAYLDDDAVACPQWLETILSIFKDVSPTPGVVGGRIEPIWEAPRPTWLSDRLARILTIINWSDIPKYLEGNEWLAGVNISYPKNLLELIGGFSTNLGRRGKSLLSGEEELVNQLIKNKGYGIYYHPDVVVKHHISASRLEKKWHYQRRLWKGISVSRMREYENTLSCEKRLKKVFLIMRREVFKLALEATVLRGDRSEAELFELKCQLAYKIGLIRGLMQI